MAGTYDELSERYAGSRPTYPREWFSKLASLTTHHRLAWDVGTGNGQAAVSLAEHFDHVIGTDASELQLKRAIPHPNVRYLHTPLSTPMQDLVPLVATEGSVDLVTVAQAVHWFDLPSFYATVARALRKPGGLLAVWCYNDAEVCPAFDQAFKRFHDTTLPYWDPNIGYLFDGYRSLPFPFEGVGWGREGEPARVEIEKEVSFDGFLEMVRSWSVVVTAREQGVDLLPEGVVAELEGAWGGAALMRKITYKAFMLVGTPKMEY